MDKAGVAELRDTCCKLERQIAESRLSITATQDQLERIRQHLERLGYPPDECGE